MDPNKPNEPYQPNNVNYYDIPPSGGDTSDTSYDQGNSYSSSNAQQNQYDPYGTQTGQQNQYDPYGQRSGSYNLNGQNYGYQTNQSQQGKRPHFTLYFVFSIIEIFFSTIFGVISLIMTILANSQYNQGDTQGAKGKLIVARVMLIIGLVLNLLFFGAVAAFLVIGQMDYSNQKPSYSVDMDDEERTVGESPDAKIGELSSDWTDFKVALDGNLYSFPCKVSDLTEQNWVLDEDYEDEIVEGDSYKTVLFEKEDYHISVYLVNQSEKDQKVSECIVGGVSVDGKYDNEGLTFSICKGISIGTSEEKAKQILGEPDYEYVGDANEFWDDYRTWTFYADGETYRGLNITLIDHEITTISIENQQEE
ncbi:MAG: hypothetical protein PUB10_07640 [Clostridiales bacterium]|nr:hypothetical protein [Clostridiales bacterium]